jgi:hypothetical protein
MPLWNIPRRPAIHHLMAAPTGDGPPVAPAQRSEALWA